MFTQPLFLGVWGTLFRRKSRTIEILFAVFIQPIEVDRIGDFAQLAPAISGFLEIRLELCDLYDRTMNEYPVEGISNALHTTFECVSTDVGAPSN